MIAEVPPPARADSTPMHLDAVRGLRLPITGARERGIPGAIKSGICNLRANEKPRHPFRQRGKSREETPKEGKFSMHGACQDAWVISLADKTDRKGRSALQLAGGARTRTHTSNPAQIEHRPISKSDAAPVSLADTEAVPTKGHQCRRADAPERLR